MCLYSTVYVRLCAQLLTAANIGRGIEESGQLVLQQYITAAVYNTYPAFTQLYVRISKKSRIVL